MQAPPPPTHRLHWMPVDPSWIVSAGLVILAVLPHQVPATFRRAVYAPLGAILFAAGTIWIWILKPVLGMAMAIFLAAMIIYQNHHAMSMEGFSMASPTIIRDRVSDKKAHRWFQEVVMQEKPKVIQERTESGRISVDAISEHDATPWYDEPEGAPYAIQERAAPDHSLAEHDEDLGGR